MTTPPISGFATAIVRWQKQHGRQNLPWQGETNPYKIWLSEVMLQQTQASAAVPYYLRFAAKFPTVNDLAAASERSALTAWSGLGYYARARNLHRAAKIIAANGFPQNAREWRQLPGVGRSTANAVAVFSLGERVPILDANVKRVVARIFARKLVNNAESLRELWSASESLVPRRANIRAFTQGMMDLGAIICLPRAPVCEKCPAKKWCRARALGIAEDIQPTRKSDSRKSARRERIVSVAVICAESGGTKKILLERRPSRGIWGGLLAPPEAGQAHCENRWGIRLSRPAPLPPVVHDFTHFRLIMRPALMRLRTASDFPRLPQCEWTGLRELESAPLPAPIRREIPNWLKFTQPTQPTQPNKSADRRGRKSERKQ